MTLARQPSGKKMVVALVDSSRQRVSSREQLRARLGELHKVPDSCLQSQP